MAVPNTCSNGLGWTKRNEFQGLDASEARQESGQPGIEAADAELREILLDEPDWNEILRVVPIELDGRDVSVN